MRHPKGAPRLRVAEIDASDGRDFGMAKKAASRKMPCLQALSQVLNHSLTIYLKNDRMFLKSESGGFCTDQPNPGEWFGWPVRAVKR